MWSGRVVAVLAGIALAAGCSAAPTTTGGALPLHRVAEVALTGGSSRFDYASLDSARGLLFLAHMGADEIVEVDVRAHTVVRTITDTPDVHGVLVVPEQHRVYATVTGRDQVVALDEDTGAVQFSTATGNYPDGLAYDPLRKAVWTTNERAGTETVVDAVSGTLRGTVSLGGEVGNVVYEPAADRMIVAVQGKDELAVIAPDSLTVESRMQTPGCAGPHGQVLVLQRHSCSGEWVAAASVMGESGLVLSASSESGPGPDMVGPVVTGEDEGDEQAADLG
ncbi:YncE family protein [Nocardia seriolae]|uniref:YncE family protein n=2 Tax=Nocardia seriolae TaxID=37332 RepID=UPI0029553C3A|nr:YncE family protein [Nocardia seriolae]BEK95616.1 hypothetical protein NSER024013_35220 [Nocardia seriolae]